MDVTLLLFFFFTLEREGEQVEGDVQGVDSRDIFPRLQYILINKQFLWCIHFRRDKKYKVLVRKLKKEWSPRLREEDNIVACRPVC
jgi:hypothetical protein